jgi:citrate synthase
MAVTCGIGLNNAMATGVNMLGDVHGGAGEQAVTLFRAAAVHHAGVDGAVQTWRAKHGPFLPGFGHRFHKPTDPRAPRLLALVDEAVEQGVCDGIFARVARAIEALLAEEKSRPVPMNIDGATAVIFAELGFEAPLARGIFCLSRSVGILAHAWEQQGQGGRNKGPTPPAYRWTYKPMDPDEPET